MRKPALILCVCASALAQQTPPAAGQADPQLPTFQSKVSLVLVPVVVRDRHGRPIGNLKKEDFQLLDQGAPQTISAFSVIQRPAKPRANIENRSTQAAIPQNLPESITENAASVSDPASRTRYFIYLFDDLHIRFADMAQVRAAALVHFKNSFGSGDFASIYTASGRQSTEFTQDRSKLQDAVSKLRWRVEARGGGMQCPDVSYYLANLVINQKDPLALAGLESHTAECAHPPPGLVKQIALAAAERQLIIGAQDTQLLFSALRRAIRGVAAMPGQRVIVLASPGWFAQTPEAIKANAAILELAARNQVIISGLSVRGVIQAEEEQDVAARRVVVGRRSPPNASAPDQLWIRYRRESATADGDVMKDLAEGTGGAFFHNNNDLRIGFERLAAVPEFSYVLAFAPGEVKTDGSFHSLKVRLANEKGRALYTVEARRGYYALPPDAANLQTRADIEDAVFSLGERSDLPVVLQTGYSKPKDVDVVKVQIAAKIGVKSLYDRPRADRGRYSLEVVVALFDSHGAFVTQTAETAQVNLDAIEAGEKDPAVTLRWELPGIKPGDYVVRLVIREPKTRATTMMNRTLKVL
jgi:VWFA-related protein